MKVFAKGNTHSKCAICGTAKAGKVVLIPLADKGEGYTYEAIQVHIACIELFAQYVGNELLLAGRFPCQRQSSDR